MGLLLRRIAQAARPVPRQTPEGRAEARDAARLQAAVAAVLAVPALDTGLGAGPLMTGAIAVTWLGAGALPAGLALAGAPQAVTRWTAVGAAWLFILVVMSADGGLGSAAAPWLAALPLFAAVAGTFRQVWASFGMILVSLIGFGLFGGVAPVGAAFSSTALMIAGGAGALVLVNARTRTEVARRAQRRNRALLDALGDVIIRHDTNGLIDYASPAVFDALGLMPSALTGRSLAGLVHPDDRQAMLQALTGFQAGEQRALLEMRMRHDDGRYVWMEIHLCRAPGAGAAGPVVSLARVVEERKQSELWLREARDAAEAASRSKSRFLANVSHELRTPLNAIIGFSEVMQNEMFGPLGGKYGEYADYIQESGRHLLDLINDILDMSKIEAGRYDLRFEPVRVALVIEKCLKTVAYGARQGGIRLQVDIADTLPEIEADARAMRQILINLLSNAVKFTPEGGEIRIVAGASRDMVMLEVADTGIGIPRCAMDRIGQPFEQVHRPAGFDGTPSETGALMAGLPGTGLGLAIVKALVGLHDGVMTIESEEGVGTTVSVALPVRRSGRDAPDTAGREAA